MTIVWNETCWGRYRPDYTVTAVANAIAAAMRHQLEWLSRRQPQAIGFMSGSYSVTRSPGGNGAGSGAVGSINRSGNAEETESIFDTAGSAKSHHHSMMVDIVSNNSSNNSTSNVNEQLTKPESGCITLENIIIASVKLSIYELWFQNALFILYVAMHSVFYHDIAAVIEIQSSDVWNKIADEEKIKKYGWTIHSVRTNVRENRRNILTRAREKCGYFVNKNLKDESDDSFGDSDDDTCCEDDDENDKDYVNKLYKDENHGLEIFDVVVDKSLWQRITIHIEDEQKNYADVKLRPKVWTHLLACPVTVQFQCRDTRYNQHEEVQWPLQGQFRDTIRREVKQKGMKGTRMKEANDLLLQPGDTQCPLLFSSSVLYQLNKESVEKEFPLYMSNLKTEGT
ncbi:hypothetical protein KQX54_015148 [Cotesia glomerata]|uniref:Uncharacterized protein n=1 Tax=Cotesia glomerata TaxID=32391 RepID=A0AAV7I326_COTGL|nr:hypothetical protein KQX54_015148 [Cotesia glomerata]